MASLTFLSAIGFVVASLLVFFASKRGSANLNRLKLPGPDGTLPTTHSGPCAHADFRPGLPFIGVVPQLPAKLLWMKFHEWSQQYGPIYNVTLMGQNHVWIGRDSVAHDILAKKSTVCSDRPLIPALKRDNRTSVHYLPIMSRGGQCGSFHKAAVGGDYQC